MGLLYIAVVFFALVLVRTFVAQAYYIPSNSMQGTLQTGDRVLINKLVYNFGSPARGDVIFFRDPSWPAEDAVDRNAGMFSQAGNDLGDLVGISKPDQHEFVKRVIGLPGDTVACCDSAGRIIVNSVGIDEPYVTINAPITSDTNSACNIRQFRPVTVPPGELFVLGDDREANAAQDSRCQGEVPIKDVLGKAEFVAWPFSHWSGLSESQHFKTVPNAAGALGQPLAPANDGGAGLVLAVPLLATAGVAGRRRRGLRVMRLMGD
jgi:signal peptidase I